MTSVLVSIAILFIIISIPELFRAYSQYRTASNTAQLVNIADDLFQAVRHYGFERGRVNVVLTNKGSLDQMAANRNFITEQRENGEKAFNNAVSSLMSEKIPFNQESLNEVISEHKQISELRKIADQNMGLPYTERDQTFPDRWFPAMTSYIEAIENFLYSIYFYVAETDPENGIGFRLKLDALSLRNTAGPECSRMLTLNSGNAVLDKKQLDEILILRTQTDLYWSEIQRIEDYFNYPELKAAISTVDRVYFTDVRSQLDQVRLSAADSSIVKIPQAVLTESVVAGLETIAGIMDAARDVTSRISSRNMKSAAYKLTLNSILSLSLIFLVILIIFLISRKIINPVAYLTNTLYRISRDEDVIDISFSERTDEIGELAGVVQLFYNYREERKLQTKRLEIEKDKAEEATRAKSIFLANMSHEIRTPITGIMGLTEMSLDLQPPDKIRENLELSLTTTESLLSIINDILDFEKISADKIIISNDTFNLHKCLRNSVDLYRYQAESRNIGLYLNISKDIPSWIKSDKIRLEQILRNLINNALKFTENGSVTVTAEIKDSTETESEKPLLLQISVEDTGCGIKQNDISSIFESFKQIDSSYSKKYQGTGLGLSICNSLISKMNGTISVDSEVNRGSKFTFIFPATVSEAVEIKSANIELAPDVPRKILFAEDEAINRLYLKYFLESDGHDVTFVKSGIELIEKLKTDKFDLVISDIQMPEMDGVEAVKTIRSGNSGVLDPEIPVIAFTAYTAKSDTDRFESAGFSGYLSKPVHIAELRKIINSA